LRKSNMKWIQLQIVCFCIITVAILQINVGVRRILLDFEDDSWYNDACTCGQVVKQLTQRYFSKTKYAFALKSRLRMAIHQPNTLP
jgi:hypothetical protein